MRILFLESFYGGSHRDVADNIVRSSRHEVELRTLPARFWKWRMRGAALSFAHDLNEAHADSGSPLPPRRTSSLPYDLVVTSGLISIPDLAATCVGELPPVLLYAHETQLSYPAPNEREADLHFAFTDLTNMLAATRIAFNSHTHRDAYLRALPGFLRRLPEHRPMWAVGEIARKSTVCYPGIRYPGIRVGARAGDGPGTVPAAEANGAGGGRRTGPPPGGGTADSEMPDRRRHAGDDGAVAPLILWNHRWEFDKAPEAFFAALGDVKARGRRFRLVLAGENFQVVPKPFLRARDEFGDEIVQYGYLPDREAYEQWLAEADIVVSTAIQENFGIAVLEAVAHGALPLLPRRLSYPEIIPEQFHDCLYGSRAELVEKLCLLLPGESASQDSTPGTGTSGALRLPAPPELVDHARGFRWERRVHAFDELFDDVVSAGDAG